MRVPAGIASVDAANCYNSIAHAIASLVFQSFGMADMLVVAMLEAIQQMKFFFGWPMEILKTSLAAHYKSGRNGSVKGMAPLPRDGWRSQSPY